MGLMRRMQNDAARCARAWAHVIYGPKGGSFENQIHFLCGMAMPRVMKFLPLDQQSDANVLIVKHSVRSDQLSNGKLMPCVVRQLAKTGTSPMKIRGTGCKTSVQFVQWIAKHFGQDRAGWHFGRGQYGRCHVFNCQRAADRLRDSTFVVFQSLACGDHEGVEAGRSCHVGRPFGNVHASRMANSFSAL